MKKLLSFTLLLFCLSTICCTNSKLEKTSLEIQKSDGTTITLQVELAQTDEQRQKGYMERKNIPEGTGMLFIFEKSQILSFWMKNTPTPLSIAYIDSNGKIRDIFDMKPYDLSSTMSSVSVKYALEVPQTWFKKNNIQIGDKIDLSSL